MTWSANNSEAIIQAARNLDKLSDTDPATLQEIWACLASEILQVEKWSTTSWLTIEGVCTIIQKVSEDQLSRLVDATTLLLEDSLSIDSPENGRKVAKFWVRSIIKINEPMISRP